MKGASSRESEDVPSHCVVTRATYSGADSANRACASAASQACRGCKQAQIWVPSV